MGVSALNWLSWRARFSLFVSLDDFSNCSHNFCVLCFWGNEIRPVFLIKQLLQGPRPHPWDLNGSYVPCYCLKFTLNMFRFSAPPFLWGHLFGSLKFAADTWKHSKFFLDLWQREVGQREWWRPSLPQAGMFPGSAVHSSPLLTEYSASVLIILEIQFTSVLLSISFPLQKMQYHIWINY